LLELLVFLKCRAWRHIIDRAEPGKCCVNFHDGHFHLDQPYQFDLELGVSHFLGGGEEEEELATYVVIVHTCIEYSLLGAVLSAVPKLPGLGFILGTLFLSEHQHHHRLK
jgi:hypothetical protein